MSVLLVHQGALGDWVLTWPVLRVLAQDGRRVIAASAWSKARLAARFIPGIEPADADAAAWSGLHAPDAEPPIELRRMLAEAELIVSFVSSGRDAWADNTARLAPRAHRVFVAPRPPEDWPGHVCDFHLRELARQGLAIEPPAIAPRNNPGGPVLLHLGSGGVEKCWPIERFEALGSLLRGGGRRVAAVLGEVEMARWPAHQVDRWRRLFNARVCLHLDDLADAVETASLWIGNDSGPTHLAAQSGLPTVAIFGPTSPERWSPRGPTVAVLAPLRPGPVTWLDPAAAASAVRGMESRGISQAL